MKKLLITLTAVLTVFALTGCGTTPKAEKPAETAPETTEATETTQEETPAEATVVESKIPDTEELLLDNFEDGLYFYAVGNSWDSYGGHNLGNGCDLSTDWKTDGEYSIKCSGEQSKNANATMATWCCDVPLEADWTGYRYAAVDFYNAGPVEACITLQIQCTDAWNWCQCDTQTFESGVQTTVLFDITKFGDENLMDVKKIMLSNMGTEATFMYFDNLRLYK